MTSGVRNRPLYSSQKDAVVTRWRRMLEIRTRVSTRHPTLYDVRGFAFAGKIHGYHPKNRHQNARNDMLPPFSSNFLREKKNDDVPLDFLQAGLPENT